ncbi:hypothetical protein ARC20_03270 [Stenotrophomonas panacihumi]|uniref:Uncharacterized protein n=1 Tax=Stenotrophomonas panacihumi TaxID=676599 RepID=A0A0R0B364_9GAMM|nr:hypothetical protein [Stenotrophomonas panacihumi]KRG47363.1 hypothetical protein ARC20_03270 [Stenotrophomonas panacihumi]PTN55841.1 hypothetical protein C9J98_04510 [Stenotrophomonas panacihumi]
MIIFEGREFPRRVDFETAYPTYRAYVGVVRDGASTIVELERRIAAARGKQRAANRAAIARNSSQPRCARRNAR